MAEIRFTHLEDLKNLLDKEFVACEKVTCIKIIRQITGKGLRETLDFFENVLCPVILNGENLGKFTLDTDQNMYEELEYNLDHKEILQRLKVLEDNVSRLKAIESKKEAANLFNNSGT